MLGARDTKIKKVQGWLFLGRASWERWHRGRKEMRLDVQAEPWRDCQSRLWVLSYQLVVLKIRYIPESPV